MSASQNDYDALSRAKTHTKLLLNNDLKDICRDHGLQVSGVKSALQQRIQQRKLFAIASFASIVADFSSLPKASTSSLRQTIGRFSTDFVGV